jgi:molybdopterin-containing oxidoreductase family iron-sulfur binding subunit
LQSGADIEGARLAFGRPLLPQYDFSKARAIVALDADFLAEMPLSARYARQWARGRGPDGPRGAMSRTYVVESRVSVTGSVADERLARPLRAVSEVARAIAAQLPLPAPLRPVVSGAGNDDVARWARAAAADLLARPRGSTIVIAGDRQPPAVHALAYAMNGALGNLGATVTFTAPVLPAVGAEAGLPLQPLDELVADMHAGRVDTLLIAGTNAVYSAPSDLGFAKALGRVRDTIYAGSYEDETGSACGTMAPIAHPFESWGDARGYDGTVSMIQPLIEPLVDARPFIELLAALAGDAAPDARRLMHQFWTVDRGLSPADWAEALRIGFQADSAAPPVAPPRVDAAAIAAAVGALADRAATPARSGTVDVELYPSPTVHDGRFANNAWLQEQPSPIAKLTWDNAAFVSPATARAFGVDTGSIVELDAGRARVRAPVMVVPGTADGVAAVWLGYGRRGQEAVADGVGFDAYPLRTRAHLHAVPDVAMRARPGQHAFARTQTEQSQHDRVFALQLPLAAYRRDPDFAAPHRAPAPSLMPEYPYAGHQWAMSIDLGLCTGCSACTVACMAENNIPVVGKDQVARGRDMNWLRIDTYVAGTAARPAFVHQPMMCQHCEKAPCEYVCPVEATTHSPDGLNEMVYNRCVGTRFCSNNCPYKVRRFNWFDWGDRVAFNRGLVQLQYNPEVTVRERGVMEKCTYCVQRIRGAGIRARLDGRDLAPGEVKTACQATCPTGAIEFGSLAHAATEMVRRRADPRAYAVLQREEGTQPRTIYLARVDNPNPDVGP